MLNGELEKKKRKREIWKRYYQKNKNKIRVKNKIKRQTPKYKELKRKWQNEYNKKHRPERRLKWRIWYKNNPDKAKSSKMKSEYGITLEEYNQMFVNQNGVCAICGEKEMRGTMLCIDHNHETKKVRGLLCRKCNSGIGYFNDDKDLVLKAINYLNKWQNK